MRLNVNVHGLTFVVPCGEGGQTFKWLGLAVAQRYATIAPHGRCRTREEAHLKQGFFLPAKVSMTQTGQVLPPMKRIADCCKDNDNVTVKLQQEVPVNEIGAPQMSAWSIHAFSSLPAKAMPPLGNVVESSTDRSTSNSTTSTSESQTASSTSSVASSASARNETDKMKEAMTNYAQSETLQQVTSGLFQSDVEIEAAFLHDFARLRVDDIERDPKEKEKIEELLQVHYAQINSAFMHYAINMGETNYGMSLTELRHFLFECGLLHFDRDRPVTEKLFTNALKRDEFVSLYQTRSSLSRVGLLHCILQAILHLNKPTNSRDDSTTVRDVIERSLVTNVSPAISRITTGPFRDVTHHESVIVLFQEAKQKLLRLYTKYAAGSSFKEDITEAPLLTSVGLKNLLQDSGIFCFGEAEQHEAQFEKAVEQCFQGMHEIREPKDRVLVFVEFLEVISRVACDVLRESDISEKDAIKIAIDALRSMPLKPPATVATGSSAASSNTSSRK